MSIEIWIAATTFLCGGALFLGLSERNIVHIEGWGSVLFISSVIFFFIGYSVLLFPASYKLSGRISTDIHWTITLSLALAFALLSAFGPDIMSRLKRRRLMKKVNRQFSH